MNYSQTNFLKAVQASFKMYQKYGARSNKKLFPLHNEIAKTLKDIWGPDFDYNFLGIDSKELKVHGKYYDKDVDITVSKSDIPVFCLGVKFVTSNYKQNANNYFENMMGETANIQSVGNVPYAQLIVFRRETPYYKKNNANKPSKIELINDKDIQKYLNLVFDSAQAHRPNMLGILIVDINSKTGIVTNADLSNNYSKEIANFLKDKISLTNFFKDISDYKNFYLLKK